MLIHDTTAGLTSVGSVHCSAGVRKFVFINFVWLEMNSMLSVGCPHKNVFYNFQSFSLNIDKNYVQHLHHLNVVNFKAIFQFEPMDTFRLDYC